MATAANKPDSEIDSNFDFISSHDGPPGLSFGSTSMGGDQGVEKKSRCGIVEVMWWPRMG